MPCPLRQVDWDKFSTPELSNFLKFLKAEEDLHVEQVRLHLSCLFSPRAGDTCMTLSQVLLRFKARRILLLKQIATLEEVVAATQQPTAHVGTGTAADVRHNSMAGRTEGSRIRVRLSKLKSNTLNVRDVVLFSLAVFCICVAL